MKAQQEWDNYPENHPGLEVSNWGDLLSSRTLQAQGAGGEHVTTCVPQVFGTMTFSNSEVHLVSVHILWALFQGKTTREKRAT